MSLRFALAAALLLAAVDRAQAAKLFETAAIGPATNGGQTLSNDDFVGARFEVTGGPIEVGGIGGHFVGTVFGPTTIFAAIVELDDANDNPDNADLSGADVIATTTIELQQSFGVDSAEFSGFFSSPETLPNGFYAMVFGGGLFGATDNAVAVGAATVNNSNPNATFFRVDAGTFVPDSRIYYFFLDSEAVPEPSSALLGLIGALGAAGLLWRRR